MTNFPNEAFKQYYQQNIKVKYPQLYQLQLKILYCSRHDIGEEQRRNVTTTHFFDYHIVQYFKVLTKVILTMLCSLVTRALWVCTDMQKFIMQTF